MADKRIEQNLADDMLDGAEEIATFMRLTRRQVYHLASNNALPLIRLGSKIRGRKSTILAYLEKLEGRAA